MSATRKKRNGGKAALVYFVTFSLFFLLIGGGAYIILDRYVLTPDNSAEEAQTEISEDLPTEDDCVTTLFVLRSDDNEVEGIILSRLMPTEKVLKLVAVAKQTTDGTATLEEIYKANGISSLITSIVSVYSIPIDKYMILNHEGFIAFTELLGGAPYTIPCDMYYRDGDYLISFTAGLTEHNLLGEDLLKIMTYPEYPQGVSFNNKMVGDCITNLLNYSASSKSYIQGILQTAYLTLFNSSETNISAQDFTSYKKWIEYILNNQTTPVIYKIPFGEWDTELFTPTADGIKDIQAYFGLADK